MGSSIPIINAADYNNDGKTDLATLWAYSIYVLQGLGNGNFTAPQPYNTWSIGLPCMSFLPVDVNNDGKMDIVFSVDNDPDASYLLNYNTAEVGIEAHSADDALMVFPNPFTDKLNITN